MGMIPLSMTTWNYNLPEIYQIEASAVCNLSCDYCIRNKIKLKRGRQFFDPDLLVKMLDRGDFKSTRFTELQLAGEPLLHPHLSKLIDPLKLADIRVGLSTNGALLRKKLGEVRSLDFMTVSVDSVKNREKYRGIDFEELSQALEVMFAFHPHPRTDLQILSDMPDGRPDKKEMRLLKKHCEENQWPAVVRSIPDCFRTYYEDGLKVPPVLCINPWMSVSVQSDGDVVPCCFSFSKELVLGNLNKNSLAEIWQGRKVKALRQSFLKEKNYNQCKKCYRRSPALLHYEFLGAWV